MRYLRPVRELDYALKLLANQQEDGDGLLQNVVTNCAMSAPWMLERHAEALEL